MQENYTRERRTGQLPTITLENRLLRAVFYPSLGGRMISLYDKGAGRDLLFNNPVFQPANLAIRNAWFSGGVEWNGPLYGHSLQTCSPVFAAVVDTPRGPLLRLYEFDRALETTWQVDLLLPAEDDRLWVHVRARNPNPHDIDFYWWTNLALPLAPDSRVLAPVDYALSHEADGNTRIAFPKFASFDGSFPSRYPGSKSVFFRKPGIEHRGRCASTRAGRGSATCRLRCCPAGSCSPGAAGVAAGLDGLPLGRRAGRLLRDAGRRHAHAVADPADPGGGEPRMDRVFRALRDGSGGGGRRRLCPRLCGGRARDRRTGTGGAPPAVGRVAGRAGRCRGTHGIVPWRRLAGRLHEQRTGRKLAAGLPFDGAAGDEERPWAELVSTNGFSAHTLDQPPRSFAVSPGWVALLEKSAHKQGATWLHHLHLGMAPGGRGVCGGKEGVRGVAGLKGKRPLAPQPGRAAQRDGAVEAAQAAYQRAVADQ